MFEGFFAEVRLWAGGFPPGIAPLYWAFCDGQTLPINTNTTLFSLLGTRFGGDGFTNFKLPKFPDPAPGLRYIICTNGIYPGFPS